MFKGSLKKISRRMFVYGSGITLLSFLPFFNKLDASLKSIYKISCGSCLTQEKKQPIWKSILKEKSDALIASYGDKATNINVKTLFNNAALSEVQKGIFRVNTQISKNILVSLQNEVNKKEAR